MAMNDLTGKIFGELTVISFSHKIFRSPRQGYYNYWKCKCNCGTEKSILSINLTKGNSKSCGCKSSRTTIKERLTIHGKCYTKTYNSWRAMKDRCYGIAHKEYKRYGALGIIVCDRWRDSYQNFLDDMGERPENYSLDRINPYGNYEPENCRWATHKEQANNKKKKYTVKIMENITNGL
jgi:hypothetical protein